ncbi:MAG: hypothetical protein WKF58_11270 [Ilumatobacteraceae bacterium]
MDVTWRALDADATTSVLRRALSGRDRVLATGWSSTLIEAVRSDVAVVVAGSGRDASSMVRALRRRDVDVEQIAMEEAAVVMADGVDAVIVDADLVTVSRVTAPVGSTVLASVAAVVDVPLWLVASRGTRLPESYRATIDAMLVGGLDPVAVRFVRRRDSGVDRRSRRRVSLPARSAGAGVRCDERARRLASLSGCAVPQTGPHAEPT